MFAEPERPAMVKALTSQAISSELARLEVKRAVFRINAEKLVVANEVLEQIQFTELDSQTLQLAEAFTPDITLRTLDAIHVASVLRITDAVKGIITYDKQMVTNAKNMGLKVLSPGAKL